MKKIRKAILTGGGRATRLHPITTTINKHLLPLANKPMIFHAIEKAVDAGVREIFINLNPGETELQKYIGDGGHWDISITFFEQEGGPQGIAHVVKQAEQFVKGEPFMFYLSDNIFHGSIAPIVEEFNQGNHDCMLAFSKVPDPERFGVPVFDDEGLLVDILEKPSNPPNNLAQTGLCLYGPDVFFKAFDNIERSARGEYEISDIHSYFLKNKYRVGHKEVTGYWKDTGQAHDLLIANKLLLDKLPAKELPVGVMIDESAKVEGNVHVGIGTQIKKDVTIVGPVIIGENCVLENCTIGPYVTVGVGTEVRGAQIENSIILANADITTNAHLVDSMIGKGVRIEPHAREKTRLILGDKSILEL